MVASRLRTLAVATTMLAVAACGSTGSNGAFVIGELQARAEAAGGLRYFEDITELLDSTHFEIAGAAARPLTEAVVLGHVFNVEKGSGFRVEGEDAPGGIEVGYDDTRSLWRTVHVRLAIDEILSGGLREKGATQITIGFAFGVQTSYDELAADFNDLGQLLLFLVRSDVFSYDTSVYGTIDDGALLGQVDGVGRIRLAVLDDMTERSLTTAAPTIADLRREAGEPVKVVRVDGSGYRQP